MTTARPSLRHLPAPALASFGHELSILLQAGPETVWQVISNYERDPEWREGVRMTVVPRGEVRPGTITHEALRMLGSWHYTTACIQEVDAGRSLRFVSEDGRVEGSRTVEACPAGARLTVRIRVSVPGPMGVIAPLPGWLFRRRVQRDLARLAALTAPVRESAACARVSL